MPFRPGDRIVTLHNDHRAGLINGQRGTITSRDHHGGPLVDFDGEHDSRVVPSPYIDAGHLDYAYAPTVHKAQGLTCDRAFVLGTDDLYAEAGYTALSRGRHENHLYIGTEHDTEIDHHAAIDDTDPLDDIRTALFRSARQDLATRQIHGLAPITTLSVPARYTSPPTAPNR